MRSRGELGLLAILGVFSAPIELAAQLSPGPLSQAHAELEGLTKCLECHGIGEPKLDARCLDCHREIDWLRARGRGLHGAAGLDECATCHQEHGGEDFEIVHWGRGGSAAFDHARAGWALEGRHRSVECRGCHQGEHRDSEVTRVRGAGLSADTWLGLETACASCHADPHAGRLGPNCAECHTDLGFHEILEGRFDHERTEYPLRGAHRRVSCAGCHESDAGWLHRPASSTCGSCHSDPHDGLATIAGRRGDCTGCHSLEQFRPSTFTVAMHAAGPFPLEGRHAVVACEACHPATDGRVQLRTDHARCDDCHADSHGNQLVARTDGGACESCHRVEGFAPSTFTIDDHRSLDFSLRGRHSVAECRSCHGPDRSTGRPASGSLGEAGVQFRFADTECRSCHDDPHAPRFADDGCLACHDHGGFSPSRVDVAMHASFAFSLEGAHAAIPCLECHRELERTTDARAAHLRFEVARRECRDCHRDPHGGQFAERTGGDACSACHGLDFFTPAVRFDHEQDAAFALEGAHAAVACVKCHATESPAGGPSTVIYRPVPRRCEDCHAGVTP